jgi:hypothetical protein
MSFCLVFVFMKLFLSFLGKWMFDLGFVLEKGMKNILMILEGF